MSFFAGSCIFFNELPFLFLCHALDHRSFSELIDKAVKVFPKEFKPRNVAVGFQEEPVDSSGLADDFGPN